MRKRPGTSAEKRTRGELKQYWTLSSLGLEIGIAFGIGVLLGWFLDSRLGTQPWLTILFSLFGIAAGFRNIVQLANKDWDEDRPPEPDDTSAEGGE